MRKVMMNLALVLSFMTLGSVSANADAGDALRIIGGIVDAIDGDYDGHFRDYPRGPGNRGVYCKAFDTGHEEHWNGHNSCRSCLREHGNCVEKCYRDRLECSLDARDRYGYRRTFEDSGQNRRNIRERLERRCYRAGYQTCLFRGCDRDNYQVSRNRCRGSFDRDRGRRDRGRDHGRDRGRR